MTPGEDDLVEGKPTRTADAKRRGAEAARQLLVGCGYFEEGQRVHRMNQLRAWVDWLTGRYNLHGTATRIAPCWYRHPVAVEELTALWVAWQAAYTLHDPTAELIAWHDRWLWPCLHRLNTAPLQLFNSCPQRHKDAALVAPTTDTDDFADFLGQQPPSRP